MLVHPDKNGGNEKAEEAFKRLQNAYEVSCIHLVAFESWVFWQLKKQGTFCVADIYNFTKVIQLLDKSGKHLHVCGIRCCWMQSKGGVMMMSFGGRKFSKISINITMVCMWCAFFCAIVTIYSVIL
jgi:hypothetical protein